MYVVLGMVTMIEWLHTILMSVKLIDYRSVTEYTYLWNNFFMLQLESRIVSLSSDWYVTWITSGRMYCTTETHITNQELTDLGRFANPPSSSHSLRAAYKLLRSLPSSSDPSSAIFSLEGCQGRGKLRRELRCLYHRWSHWTLWPR